MSMPQYETILTEVQGRVGIIRINRPAQLNALNSQVTKDVVDATARFDKDDAIGAMIITGSEKAFAAGADIKEMQNLTFPDTYTGDFISGWDKLMELRKPLIAAVAGYALGGGCEVAMMADFIIAADNAKFGQPEITLGVMPGMGGSQRLTRLVGRAKAMDLCLTGRMMGAEEAERSGLVARVVPLDKLMEESLAAATKIADFATSAVMANKEVVNRATEMTLWEGLRFERRLFQSLFATPAQKEGMSAFIEKRKPKFHA